MNIKELIEKYELELKDVQLKFGANYKTKVYEGVLDDLKQLRDRINQLCRSAWLDGYEVEKEPKYTVKFKATKQYLSNDELGPHFDPSFRSNFTKSDLEKLGLAEVFNSPLFEVEEV